MTRPEYLKAVIRFYLSAPDTPCRARRSDWAVASTFYQQALPLETVEHAVRLATLRRNLRPPALGALEPIHSLAYFHHVITSLTPETSDSAYVDYVKRRFDELLGCDDHVATLSLEMQPKTADQKP